MVVIVGIYIIVNLFLAALLNAFAIQLNSPEEAEKANDQWWDGGGTAAQKWTSIIDEAERRAFNASMKAKANVTVLNTDILEKRVSNLLQRRKNFTVVAAKDKFISSFKKNKKKEPWPENCSLLLFREFHPVRVWCQEVEASKPFDVFMLATIVFSTLLLIFDVPRTDPSSELGGWVRTANKTITAVFTLEASLKIIARTFASKAATAYARSLWNVLDFTIVTIR